MSLSLAQPRPGDAPLVVTSECHGRGWGTHTPFSRGTGVTAPSSTELRGEEGLKMVNIREAKIRNEGHLLCSALPRGWAPVWGGASRGFPLWQTPSGYTVVGAIGSGLRRGAGPETPARSSLQGPARGTAGFRFALPAGRAPALPLPRCCLCGQDGWVSGSSPPFALGTWELVMMWGLGSWELGLCPSSLLALPCPAGCIYMTQDPDGTPGCVLGQGTEWPAALRSPLVWTQTPRMRGVW